MTSYTDYLDQSLSALRQAESPEIEAKIESAVRHCVDAARSNLPILVCGNGGSAADSEHIVGELVGRFSRDRRPINAISLVSQSAMLTGWCNDLDFDTVFARQVKAYGKAGGVLLALSTSGRSPNVVNAAIAAREVGVYSVAFTGSQASPLGDAVDLLLSAPSTDTPIIQQIHEVWYHYLCLRVEQAIV